MFASLIGVWNATSIQTFPLILLAHIFFNGNDYAGYIEVPERNIKIRIDIFNVDDTLIDFNMTSIKTSFEGHLNGSMIQGIWKNASMDIPIQFNKVKNHSKYEVKRPQTPKRPFRYIEEEIELKNLKANISLSGTFTCPKNQKPIASVVLCHGSGGHDRDVTMFDHKPFMVLADHLSNNGIAVLRFDERGIRKSSGNFSAADFYDFADDVIEGIKYLKNRKETSNSNIGVIGHSKGGSTAMIASDRSKLIKFMVLLGTISIPLEENYYQQIKLVQRAKKTSEALIEAEIEANSYIFKILKTEKNDSIVLNKIALFFEDRLFNSFGQMKQNWKNLKKKLFADLDGLISPMLRSGINLQPGKILSRTKIPVLGIWGSNDLIVPPSVNLKPMKKALESARNKNFKLVVIDQLNHGMQKSKTGLPNEYERSEETISLFLLENIQKWIHKISL